MSYIIWNARGLGNPKAIHNLHRLIADEDPSLLFLCETKLVSGQCRNFKYTFGFEGCFVQDCIGRKGGLILLWKDPLKVEIKSCSAGHIDAIIDHNLRTWRFTGFYGSPTVEGRVASWQLLQRLGSLPELCHLPWLVGGDFNEVLYDHEKKGGRPRSLSQMQSFQEALDHCCLRNITGTGEFFTWANKQLGSDFIQERLDLSDKMGAVVNGLQRCAKETDAWGFKKYGKVKKQIADLRKNIEAKKTDNDHGPCMLEISNMEKHLECLLDKEEIYWKQRSRMDWLTHGDRNSKFFHHKASERRKKNFVEGIKNEEGEWCTDIDSIGNAVTDYFDKLFSSSNPSVLDMDTVLSCVKPRVSQCMNEHLSRPFTGDEIRTALADMPPTKSPGPDGMPGLFFQKYWDIVGDEITEAALLVLNNEGDIHQWNQTLITLIPKIQSPTQVSDFRPISLCNVVYKLVSRTITNRFSRILDEVIGDQQSAFVPGRLITDNVLLGFETMHWLRQHRGGNTGYAALKLDMSKAYDRVEWSFLEGMMLRLGFADSWVKLIMRCVRSVSYSFLINRQVSGAVIPHRGLRQGDPLSPYLFVLCAHGLSEMLACFEERKLFTGIKIASGCPSISHLFFADDSLIFCKAKLSEATHLKSCLNSYAKASGQLINFDKSAFSFSPNTRGDDKITICSVFGVNQVQSHELYLGLPTFSMKNKRIQFGYVRDRVIRKLQGWKERTFSQGGKEVLLKSVVQSIPTYTMSCFILPDSIIQDIEAACARFWWGSSADHKKVHWKRWIDLCKPKSEGGLGFRHLAHFNQALLGKQVWRFLQRPNSLLYRVFKAKYFHSSTIWHASANSKASYVWKSILWGRNLVAKGIRWRVGDGRSISVYNSRWIPTPHSFMVNSPRTLPADSLVSELLDNAGRWNTQLIRDSFLDFEAKKILQIPRSSLNLADSYCWHFDNKGLYSVRSAYKLALHTDCVLEPTSSSSQASNLWNFLWQASIPPKVKIFWWRALHNIIPTSWNLRVHHVPTDLKCSLCGSGIETTVHSLFLCPKVKFIWKKSGMVDCLSAARSGNMVDVAFWAKDHLSSENFELFAMYTWEVWNLRNSWTHGKEAVLKGNELRWIPDYLSSFKACRSTMHSLPRSPQPRCWTAPLPGQLRLDVDAAFDADTKCFGLGAVIRDNTGSLIVAGVWPGQQASSVGMAELLAVKAGLKMAKDYEQSSLIVYCDAINEVAKLQMIDLPANEDGIVLSDIKQLASTLNVVSFNYSPRICNGVAHCLAKNALHRLNTEFWLDAFQPSWLVSVLLADFNAS
ncbi:hypothetical protein UlMin_012861 [Ulmus minor]